MQDSDYISWIQPSGIPSLLLVQNSLCPQKLVPFMPQEEKVVNWYSCGPTTYAPSHLGHARAYITFDILRRLMQNYFGYKVNFVQNVTDIEDKIILHARQNYVLEQYDPMSRTLEELK